MAIDLSRQLVARWGAPEPSHVPLLRRAGIEALVTTDGTAPPGIAGIPESALAGAVTRGTWPGIRRPGRARNWENDMFASASAEPWIDSNLYVAAFERAVAGNAARPIIAFQASPETGVTADRPAPFESLEIALAEARMTGANYVLSIDPRYRAALLAGDSKALAAWTSLGNTARWLSAHEELFGRLAPPSMTVLVEPGDASAEIANLLYRRNASPRLVPASAPPAPDARNILLVVAASLKTVPAAVWRHAEGGSTAVIDNQSLVKSTWRRLKQEQDRDFYSLGAGRVVVYKRPVADPSEFALDMIDLVGHRLRAARLWNAQTAVTFATAGPGAGEALLHLVNYGASRDEEVQARIHGHFQEATLLHPDGPAVRLKTAPRGLATEVFLPKLGRAAVVRFRT